MANVIWAIWLQPWMAFVVGGAAVIMSLVQKHVLKTYSQSVVTAKSAR